MVCHTFSFIVLIKNVVIVGGDGDGGGGCSQIKLGDTNMRWHVLFALSFCGVRNMCAMCASMYVYMVGLSPALWLA